MWLVPRPASELVPEGTRAVGVFLDGTDGRAFPVSTVADPSAVSRLIDGRRFAQARPAGFRDGLQAAAVSAHRPPLPVGCQRRAGCPRGGRRVRRAELLGAWAPGSAAVDRGRRPRRPALEAARRAGLHSRAAERLVDATATLAARPDTADAIAPDERLPNRLWPRGVPAAAAPRRGWPTASDSRDEPRHVCGRCDPGSEHVCRDRARVGARRSSATSRPRPRSTSRWPCSRAG